MQNAPKRILGKMAARLFSLPVGDYLLSPDFSGFLREHDLDEAWTESIGLARDRPDLFGDAVMKNAFVEFLQHAIHRHPDNFPGIFTGFLAGFSRVAGRPLPLNELRNDLADLGFSDQDLAGKFAGLESAQMEQMKRLISGCED